MATQREEFLWAISLITNGKTRGYLRACGVSDDELECLIAILRVVTKKVIKAKWGS
jgi:hypothetical protein